MKKLFYTLFLLIILPSCCYALEGYSNHKDLLLTGSTAGETAAGYVIPISVSPDADPVESGTWTVNEVVYKYRIPITVTEVTGNALTDYVCLIEINTKILYQRGMISSTQTGNEVEFYDGSTNYTYYLKNTGNSVYVGTGIRKLRTPYYVKLSLTAYQTKTIYFYFSNMVTAASSNSKTMAQMFESYTYDSRTLADLDDVYATKNSDYNFFNGFYDTTELTTKKITYLTTRYKTYESGLHFTNILSDSHYVGDQFIGFGSATLTVTSASGLGFDLGTNLSTEIVAEASDNAAVFSTLTDYKTRTKSTTVVAWNITSAWTNDTEYTSPNIGTVIQSVISRSGFEYGNSLNLYWRPTSACAVDQGRYVYPFNADPDKTPRLQFTAYLHPDYKIIPMVTMPELVNADVYLDGDATAFPYDVTFTAADGTTQLYQADMPERLNSDTKVVTWGVKTSAAVPQSGNLQLNIWYTNSGQTTRHAYWSASDTFTYFNDFESGITDFTTVSGTWAQGTQQRPLIKGGKNGWTRSPVIWKVGTTYKILDTPAFRWTDFGLSGWLWELPWSGGTLHTASIIDDYWYSTGYPAYENRSLGMPTGNQYWNYPGNVVTNDGGTTYYRVDANPAYQISLAKSTDGGDTWTFVKSLFTMGDGGTLVNYAAEPTGFLYWETDTWYLYVGYVGIGSPPLYIATLTDPSPEGDFTVYANAGVPYNMHPYTDYQEEVKVVKEGSTYYTFAGNIQACPSPYQAILCQRVVYSSANSPLGDTSTHTFSVPALVTMTTYDGTYTMQGMPSLLKDGEDWYMVYFGQAQSPNETTATGTIDDFLYLAKASTFPTAWTPQKTIKTLQSSTSGAADIILKDSTSYSNVVINTNIELPYGAYQGGVVFRYQDANNYYYVALNRTYHVISICKVVSGVSTQIGIAYLKYQINHSGTFYPIRIGLYGNQIVVQSSQYGSFWDTYINVSDSSLATSGQIGYIGSLSKVYVDDIAISPYIYPEISVTNETATPTPPVAPYVGTTFKVGTGTSFKIN